MFRNGMRSLRHDERWCWIACDRFRTDWPICLRGDWPAWPCGARRRWNRSSDGRSSAQCRRVQPAGGTGIGRRRAIGRCRRSTGRHATARWIGSRGHKFCPEHTCAVGWSAQEQRFGQRVIRCDAWAGKSRHRTKSSPSTFAPSSAECDSPAGRRRRTPGAINSGVLRAYPLAQPAKTCRGREHA